MTKHLPTVFDYFNESLTITYTFIYRFILFGWLELTIFVKIFLS